MAGGVVVTIDTREPVEVWQVWWQQEVVAGGGTVVTDTDDDDFEQGSKKEATKIRRACLEVGDIAIEDDILRLVVERKRADDLLSSVSDGRLGTQWSQWWSMMTPSSSNEKKHIVGALVIEEGLDRLQAYCRATDRDREITHRSFLRTWLQTKLTSPPGFFVLRTDGPVETARVTRMLFDILLKRKKNIQDNNNDGSVPSVPWCVDTDRLLYQPPPPPRGFTRSSPGCTYIRQLCCIKGVSVKRAMQITAIFPSMSLLCAALTDNPDDTEAMLSACLKSKVAGKAIREAHSLASSSSSN